MKKWEKVLSSLQSFILKRHEGPAFVSLFLEFSKLLSLSENIKGIRN